MAKQENLYAVVDGAVVPQLFDLLEQYDPPFDCLYAEPIEDNIRTLIPYLLCIDDPELKQRLQQLDTPWGLILHSPATLKELRHHLRKYLRVTLPDQPQPVLLRFYDPRNIWLLTEVLTDWQLHSFIGPVTAIETTYPVPRVENFQQRRGSFPAHAFSKSILLKLDSTQQTTIEKQFTLRYVTEIAGYISTLLDQNNQINQNNQTVDNLNFTSAQIDIEDFSQALVYYLKEIKITHDASIKKLIGLLFEHHIYKLEHLPLSWKNILEQTDEPDYYRIDTILLREREQL